MLFYLFSLHLPLSGAIVLHRPCNLLADYSASPIYPDEIGSIVPPADNYDSVSTDKAQIADTEYTVPPADNYDSVSSKAISTYRPRGTARSGEYFRFSYRDGSRMRHIQIRGGNTDSPIAQAKVQKVRSLLTAGVSPAEVAAMLKKKLGKF